jgi:hypothetical protein
MALVISIVTWQSQYMNIKDVDFISNEISVKKILKPFSFFYYYLKAINSNSMVIDLLVGDVYGLLGVFI